MALRLRVTYLDGRVEEVIATPRSQVMTEEKFNGISSSNRLRASYYMGWAALHRAGREGADYDAFLDSIEDVIEMDDPVQTEVDADPTPAAPPTTTSPD